MIYISELSKTFSGQKVLNNLSLEIQKGEVVALIGSSGAGKSTFLRSLNYLEAPDSGRIKIDDFEVDFEHITQDQILTLRRKLAMVFQQFNLFGRKTALENVKEGLIVVKGLSDQEATKIAREELAKVGLSDRENHYPRHLSGGQKQRVALARALAMKPEVLLLDEPTRNLSALSAPTICRILADYQGCIFSISHDRTFLRSCADTIYEIKDRKLAVVNSIL
jgi:polar amino acid transport system ATP-binding protein